MASDKLVRSLNDLLNIDLQSHQIYLQAAAWALDHKLEGCKNFLVLHANEELQHMTRSFNYLDDRGLTITFTALPDPALKATTVAELFNELLEHENKVTSVVNTAVDTARAENDHDAFEFLQWFVLEQREETKVFRNVIDKITLIGDGPSSLYFIDQEVSAIAAAAAAAATVA